MEVTNKPRHLDTVYIIIRDILKNWVAIICVALSAALISYIIASMCYVPKYTSRCTMIVSAKVNNTGVYTDTAETEKLTSTITAVMKSTVLKKKTAEALGMEEFEGGISISIIPNTNLLEISVTSYNPNSSFRMLKTLLELYPEISKDILGEIVMEIFEEPSFPSSPSNAFRYKSTINLSFIIAAGVVILIAAMHSFLLETVKNEWDASDMLDAKLLGVLYHESPYRNLKARLLRKKKRLLMGAPSVSFGFCETVKKIRTNVSYYQEKNGGKVLLVTSYDRKEGKTTVSANLAYALTQRNQRVLLIPGKASYSDLLDILNITLPEEFTDGKKEDISQMVYCKDDSYLSVLVNAELSGVTGYSDFIASEAFGEFLLQSKEHYDYIIVDGPCANSSSAAEILAQLCDFSLLVVRQNYTKVPFINDTIDMLNRYNMGLAGIVFNNVYSSASVINIGYGYGYGGYSYGSYGKYGGYGKYGRYGKYGSYGAYGNYAKHSNHSQHKKHEAKRYKK